MFELAIILSRYLFIFFIIYFLIQGCFFILSEKKLIKSSSKVSFYISAISKQKITLLFMHVIAFLILAYLPSTFYFDTDTLITGGSAFVLFLVSFFLTPKIFKNSCPLMWNCIFFVFDVGLIMIQRLDSDLARKQLIWFSLGIGVAYLIPFVLKLIPKFELLKKLYLIAGLALLILPSILGVRTFGAINWVNIAGFSFQPSEIVKFLFVFYLATVFKNELPFKKLLLPSIMSAIFVLILVSQKDLGGALIFFMTFVIMLYISTGSQILFIGSMGFASIASYFCYSYFAHFKVRVMAWQNPWKDISGDGYQIAQSLFAIGTWGFIGSGLTRGEPYFIPVVYSDFIFSAICEEFGSLFGICLILVYIMIFYRGIHFSLCATNKFFALVSSGFTAMLAFQTFLIIGGTIKFIPLTGVTMPFVSYGGSSILISVLMIGILQWIYGKGRCNG